MDEKKPEPTKLQTDFIFEKMQNEIDRLTADRDKWQFAYEEDDIRTNGLCEKVERLDAENKELKAKSWNNQTTSDLLLRKSKELQAKLTAARKKPELLVYSIWEEQERQHLVDIGADCTRISAQKAWQVQQAEIDRLTAENRSLIGEANDYIIKNNELRAELKAKDEKARLFRLEVQEAVESLIGCEDEKALEILEQVLKDTP